MLVQEQLARTGRLVVEKAAPRVGSDMAIIEPQLALFTTSERIPYVDATLANRLDLCAGQNQPGLDTGEDLVVVQGLAVDGDLSLFQYSTASR